MPEGYTHIRTAERAANMGNISIEDKNIFGCGANGPDILFSYKVWMKSEKRGENLPLTGSRLHDENTGAFLKSIVSNAKTKSQKEYVLGFLSHYAADCTIHPFIVMLTEEGMPYNRIGGHGYSEIAIDSYLHKRDTGSGIVGVNSNTPKVKGEALEGAAEILQKGIHDALGEDFSKEALMATFRHTRNLRRFFISPFKILYCIYYLIEPLFGKRGFITGHVSPVRLKKLPEKWKNPFTGEETTDDLGELLKKAEKLSLKYMQGALSYWEGKTSIDELTALLGSNSYLKGIPDEMSDPKLKLNA